MRRTPLSACPATASARRTGLLLGLLLVLGSLATAPPAAASPEPVGWSPPFTLAGAANGWWIEVHTAHDVTGVDVIGRGGEFYLSLTWQSWGAWAASPPSELRRGDTVQFVARRSSDGSSAASEPFGWMENSSPRTRPGWNASIARGPNCTSSWVELVVSAGATAVSVKAGAAPWAGLHHNPVLGSWVKPMNVAAGTKVVAMATRVDGAQAYSPVFTWLQ